MRITENGNIRRLVRDRTEALARPLMEMGATTNAVRWFVWANGKLLAQVASNGTIRVAHSDELGKILALTDNNGALTDEYAYQPYGRMIVHSGTNDLPFAFMGDYGVWNAGSGLSLARHRAYDANLMRFLQPDPIGLEGGRNLYAFAEGTPIAFVDPLGLNGNPISAGGTYIYYPVGGWNAVNIPGATFDHLTTSGFGNIYNLSEPVLVIAGEFATGAAVGAAGAVVVVGVAAGAAAVGVPAAVITTGLGVVGVVGGVVTVLGVAQDVSAGDWNAVSYDIGAIAGGAIVGIGSGRPVAEFVNGEPSPPWSWRSDMSQHYNPLLGSLGDWIATGTSPGSAGGAIAAAGAGAAQSGGCK